ncbi:hypothetical protein [Alkalilimnicola ehrlichii]|nr:hypothetical protein [Alkalilimnicola ehrlichii]
MSIRSTDETLFSRGARQDAYSWRPLRALAIYRIIIVASLTLAR